MQRPRLDIKLTFLLGNFIRKMVITHRNTVLEKPHPDVTLEENHISELSKMTYD